MKQVLLKQGGAKQKEKNAIHVIYRADGGKEGASQCMPDALLGAVWRISHSRPPELRARVPILHVLCASRIQVEVFLFQRSQRFAPQPGVSESPSRFYAAAQFKFNRPA